MFAPESPIAPGTAGASTSLQSPPPTRTSIQAAPVLDHREERRPIVSLDSFRFAPDDPLGHFVTLYPTAGGFLAECGLDPGVDHDLTVTQAARHLGLDPDFLLCSLAEHLRPPPPRQGPVPGRGLRQEMADLRSDHRLIIAEFDRLLLLAAESGDSACRDDRGLLELLSRLRRLVKDHQDDEEFDCFPVLLAGADRSGAAFDAVLENWAGLEHNQDEVRLRFARLLCIHSTAQRFGSNPLDRLVSEGLRGLLRLLDAHALTENRIVNDIISTATPPGAPPRTTAHS